MDSLPTCENLRKRTIHVSNECPLCSETNGTTAHLFFECPYSKVAVWRAVSLELTIEKYRRVRGEFWFRQLLMKEDTARVELIMMLCDTIWFQRNRSLFEGKKIEQQKVAPSVGMSLRSFKNANGWPERISTELHPHTLLRPPDVQHQVFFYAGIQNTTAGLGILALANDGAFIHAVTKNVPGVSDPTLAKGLACVEAISLVTKLGLREVAFVGDSLGLTEMIRGAEEPTMACLEIVTRIRSLLDVHGFPKPYWVPRDHNILAHSLASYAKKYVIGTKD